MKHIQIANLESPTVVFTGATQKRKRELLQEAALLSDAVLTKDKERANKLSEAMSDCAREVAQEAEKMSKQLIAAAATVKNASDDFVGPLVEQTVRMIQLTAAPHQPKPSGRKPFQPKPKPINPSVTESSQIPSV